MAGYTAYQLNIESSLPLPELLTSARNADVTIRLGELLPPERQDGGTTSCLLAAPQEAWLSWDEVGVFRVRHGTEVVIMPAPGVKPEVLRLFLLGPAMAFLLHQRGRLILHGSAVAVDGQAVVILGASGWGKSTLAAALHARGHDILADDLAVIDPSGRPQALVLPGFPQLKLWPEAATSLHIQPETLVELHPQMEKRGRRLLEGFKAEPLPLGMIYVLAEHEQAYVKIESLQPQMAFVDLIRHSFLARLLAETGAGQRHFEQCTCLVNSCPMRRISRRKDLADLPQLAAMVEADVIGKGFSHASHPDSRS